MLFLTVQKLDLLVYPVSNGAVDSLLVLSIIKIQHRYSTTTVICNILGRGLLLTHYSINTYEPAEVKVQTFLTSSLTRGGGN